MKIKGLLSIALFSAASSFAQELPLDPAVRTGKLANGFTYFIRKNTEPAKRVQLYLVNKVGSVLERDDQQGLAHFMEHMSFNGTTHFPKNELVEYLQKSGVRFGADLNAYTSFDETVYQLPIPTDDPKLLKNGFQIMRDWAQNATLDPKEIDAERGVVLEEKRLGKGAQDRMREKTFPVMLNHSRYSDRLPIGTEEVLKTFPKQAILDFYNDWYRPDLQALIVVGDIDVSQTEQTIKTMFSDLKGPANPKPRTIYKAPLTGQNQFLTVTDKENQYTILQLFIKTTEKLATDLPGYNALTKRSLINQLISGRLQELSQQANTPFLQVQAGMDGFLGGLDAFEFVVVPKEGELEKATTSAWAEIERIRRFGFTQPELDRAKTNYLASLESAVREKDKRSSEQLVQEYTRLFLKGEASPGIEKEFELANTYLQTLDLTTINQVAASWIKDTDRDIIIMAPEKDKASLPGETVVTSWLQNAGNNLTAYNDAFSATDLLPNLPPAGSINSSKSIPAIGLTKLTLSNGATVLLKPTNFKNDEIQFNIFSPGGTSLYPDSDYQSAANAAGFVDASGIGSIRPTDFPKLLAGKRLSVQPYITDRNEGLSGNSTPKDLETTLQLIHLYFTQPRPDSTVFNNIISQSSTAINSRYSNPNNVFADTIASVLGNHSVRRTGPSIEKLNSISMDKLFRIYKERFANAADFNFVFTGNFSIDSIRTLLEKYIGSLPANGSKENAKDLGLYAPAGYHRVTVRKGSEDKAMVRMVISGDYTYNAANNAQLTALADILQFRITERLREKEGGAYSPAVRSAFGKLPRNRYNIQIIFGCAPANVEKLITAAKEEIKKLATSGATASDLQKFKSEETRQFEIGLQTNQFWLDHLTTSTENKEDPAAILKYKAGLSKITGTSIKTAAKQFLQTGNLLEFVLLPE